MVKADLENMSCEEIKATAAQLIKTVKNLSKHKRRAVRKLRVKSRALWISAGYIADSKIMPKTQQEVYELLKMVAKSELIKEYTESINNTYNKNHEENS